MTITASGTAADTHQADRIARLFAEGHGIDFVCERGVQAGWTRARVLQVVRERGWTLDGSGLLPRADRPAVIPGRPVPRQAARMPAAGTIGGPPPAAVPAPRPSPGRAQLDALLGTQAPTKEGAATDPGRVAAPARGTAEELNDRPRTTAAGTAPATGSATPAAGHGIAGPDAQPQVSPPRTRTAGKDGGPGASDASAGPTVTAHLIDHLPVHDLLEAGAAHTSHDIRTLADQARALIADLRAALTHDAEQATLRARLAQLDAEREALLARLATRPPAPDPLPQRRRTDRPINHGTWGGWQAHTKRGETPCGDCEQAKHERMATMRAKKAEATS